MTIFRRRCASDGSWIAEHPARSTMRSTIAAPVGHSRGGGKRKDLAKFAGRDSKFDLGFTERPFAYFPVLNAKQDSKAAGIMESYDGIMTAMFLCLTRIMENHVKSTGIFRESYEFMPALQW